MTGHSLFVPGRLCLAGEHSDWAAAYRLQSPSISKGAALVVGLQQGLRAIAKKTPQSVIFESPLGGKANLSANDELRACAQSASTWRYAAGTAHIVHTRFSISGGLSLRITEETLPPAKGFSSSAAVCVLVARAYNVIYRLGLTTVGEMDVAYAGERLTGSACGRMDQVVAIGPGRCARMTFDGEYVSHELLPRPRKPVYIVVCDLGASKDTTKILAGLRKAFPERSSEERANLHDALGEKNLRTIHELQQALEDGNASSIGLCMTRAQKLFDDAAIPFCPEELSSPLLHKILNDSDVEPLVYGGKGVGSQGDGAVQFVARNHQCAVELAKVLRGKLGTEPRIVTISAEGASEDFTVSHPAKRLRSGERNRVGTAVIPAAGFGTRLFPASRSIRPKALFPIVDADGFAKPLLLHLVEQCADAGIERIIVVVGPGEQEERVKEMFSPVPKELYSALKPHMRDYADRIAELESLVELSIQAEPKGFGHAVACAKVDPDSPFLLLLGDVAFRSRISERSCVQQTIETFHHNPSQSVIAVTQVPMSEAGPYGVVKTRGGFDGVESCQPIQRIVEKPNHVQAEELSRNGKCNIVLGPYVFTPSLMRELQADVKADRRDRGEIQLTTAMITVHEKEGINALRLEGEALDTGNATEYVRTLAKLGS